MHGQNHIKSVNNIEYFA